MKVVVIGGNPAGLSGASAIRRAHSDWEIDVYEKDQFAPVWDPILIAANVARKKCK